MRLDHVFKILENKIDVFRGIDFAYIPLTEDLKFTKFDNEDDLDRYANRQPEDNEQIALKAYEDGTGRIFFIVTTGYSAIIIDDGKKLSLFQYRKKTPQQEIQHRKPDYEKAHRELESYFSNPTAETKKLAS